MDSSIIKQQSLVDTKWLVQETKGLFAPFFITFKEGGVADVVTVNKYFSGQWNYEGDYGNVNFYGSYSGNSEEYNCIGEPSQQEGHYTATWSGGKQIGKFTMVQQ